MKSNKTLRKFFGNWWKIHIMVFLGLFGTLGYVITGQSWIIFFVVLSFAGAVCGAFIKLFDLIRK
jgi:hypothetical protein